jgi:zona occludens toxin
VITLITGGPGTGKTAWLIDQLLELRKREPSKLLFIHGVRSLVGIAHETIYCSSQLCDMCRGLTISADAKFVENWHEWKQADSLIVVDEVQRIWRPRSGASAPPDSVSALETHRHYGLDFWLISQGPHLFDNFIRLLVGRHVHLVARWSGRTQYEWPECKQDVQSRSDAVVRPYKLPSHVYTMYHSAEVHTKQDKRKPISFYALIVAVLCAVMLLAFVGKRISTKVNPDPVANTTAKGGGGVPTAPLGDVSTPAANRFPDFTPSRKGVNESAPAYGDLIKVKSVPLLMGCVKTPEFCRCYTNQGTPYPTTALFCSEFIAGHVYNPYRPPRGETEPQDIRYATAGSK